MARKKVAIIIGSDSDWPVMEKCYQTLREFEVPTEVQVLSAHRTPEQLSVFVQGGESRGVGVFIAGAGDGSGPSRGSGGLYASPGDWGSAGLRGPSGGG